MSDVNRCDEEVGVSSCGAFLVRTCISGSRRVYTPFQRSINVRTMYVETPVSRSYPTTVRGTGPLYPQGLDTGTHGLWNSRWCRRGRREGSAGAREWNIFPRPK